MIVSNKEDFISALNNTITWCNGKVNIDAPKSCLRSEVLKPVFKKYKEDVEAAWLSSGLIEYLLSERNSIKSNQESSQVSGRVLLVAYEYTNYNGLTEFETGGYFDENDTPPWDTWICEIQCLKESKKKFSFNFFAKNWWPETLDSILGEEEVPSVILATWVPDCFIESVQNAIDVECCGMLLWADEKYPETTLAPNYRKVIPTWFQTLYQSYS